MTRIGLLSDSHGSIRSTRAGVQALLDAGADILIHLGDIETAEVIEELVAAHPEGGDPIEVHVVFGNVDWDSDSLAQHAERLGLKVDHPVGSIRVEGRRVVFMHGDNRDAMRQALAEGPDYLCHGHTHRQRDDREGRTRMVNPGALNRAASYSVAMLDLPTDQVRFLTVNRH